MLYFSSQLYNCDDLRRSALYRLRQAAIQRVMWIYVDQRIYTCVVRVVVWQEPHTRIVSCIVKWIYYCEHQNLVFHILYKKSKKALGVVHYFVTYFDLTRYVFDVCGAFAHFHKEGDTHKGGLRAKRDIRSTLSINIYKQEFKTSHTSAQAQTTHI